MRGAKVAGRPIAKHRDRYQTTAPIDVDPRPRQPSGNTPEEIDLARRLVVTRFGADAGLALRMMGIDVPVDPCGACDNEPVLGPVAESLHTCELVAA